MRNALIQNDAIVFGILIGILYVVFSAANSSNTIFRKIFKYLPPILLSYFLPGLLNTFNIIAGETSAIYPLVSKFLLPPCLFLFVLGLDFTVLKQLGSQAILMFFIGTIGIIIGAPIAVLIVKQFFPEPFLNQSHEIWRGLATVAGSWIGGGANQTALKEIFKPTDYVFSQSVAVDIIVAELWLAIILIAIDKKDRLNKWLKADSGTVQQLLSKVSRLKTEKEKVPTFLDYLKILAFAFGASAVAYFMGGYIAPYIGANYPNLSHYSLSSEFFWVVAIVTALGIVASQTKLSQMEQLGSPKIAMVFLYLLIAAIGMQMDILAILKNPALFLVGFIWIFIHGLLLIIAAKIFKSPVFLIAIGSQANVGGAASASVVAAAFSPLLIPVGVMLSILGYAVGTYAGYITALLLKWACE